MMNKLWTSRRKKFLNCTYYNVIDDERLVPNNVLIHNIIPSGYFKAEILGTTILNAQVEGETFMMPQQTMTIQTEDDISDLRENDVIVARGKTWRVDEISWKEVLKQQQFLNTTCKEYTISLRG